MPITKIQITIEPPPAASDLLPIRVLTFLRDTKQWHAETETGGLYPGEIALIGAIDKARQGNPV